MPIPNADRAVIDVTTKLKGCSLNPEHLHGGTHARKFASVLGMTADHAEALGDTLHEIVKSHDAELREKDELGQRYRIRFTLRWNAKQSETICGWIVRTNEDFPRLVTCYLLG